jgi:hypothetical protein
MKKHVWMAAAATLFSSLALAGFLQPAPVIVTINGDGSGSATGDMVTARFSANTVEFIGCGTRSFDDGAGGAFRTGFCQAGDAAGVQFTCFTENPGLLDSMQATADFSFITFRWNADGECTAIGFSTQSFYIPDFNAKKSK